MKMQKKINAAILIFDVVLGLLLLFVLANKQGAMFVGVLSQKVVDDSGVHEGVSEGICERAIYKETADEQAISIESAEQKKIALTFDDDVIIGLSQEISYKEAVSMI